jgi:hypothetical protein
MRKLIDHLVIQVLNLADVYRRLICIGLISAGVIAVYLGPVTRIVSAIFAASESSRFDRVRDELALLTSELARVGAELKRYGDTVVTSVDGAALDPALLDPALISEPGILQIIDRASRQTSLIVGALESVEGRASQDGNKHERYRLALSGNYHGITKFIEILSNETPFVTIVEVDISAEHRQYPAEPLVAQLLLEG